MSLVFNAILIGSGVGGGVPTFTYFVDGVDRASDPAYVDFIDDGGGNWRIHFLKSGTLTFTKLGSAASIDLFLVGGGGGTIAATGGGGGGYTNTVSGIAPQASTQYQIVVGAGGEAADGGSTSAFSYSAAGGKCGGAQIGGDGGSGGGGWTGDAESNGANGGSDGSNGYSGSSSRYGNGQGTTTREFGESGGLLYAGGGAGGSGWGAYYVKSTGGAGGGGDSGYGGTLDGSMTTAGADGTPNTGGGGGARDGKGGSGIVSIRNHR